MEGRPKPSETTYEWEIVNFSMCPHSQGECLKSNIFYVSSFDLSQYLLILFPRGWESDNNETPQCILECHKESDYPINVTMRIAFGEEEMEMKRENIRMNTGNTIQFPIETKNRNPEVLGPERFALLPGGIFTIRCTITLIDPQIDPLDLFTFSDNLLRLGQERFFADFYLTSSDDEMFHVHKIILISRCPKLANKIDSSIEGPMMLQQTARALHVFLHYVYAGCLPNILTPELLDEVNAMAEKYEMDSLKRELFALEISSVGRTVIKLEYYIHPWTIDGFRMMVEENDHWPTTTFIDFDIGSFVASLSVAADHAGKTSAHLDLKCQGLKMSRTLTMKWRAVVVMPSDVPSKILREWECKFHHQDLDKVISLEGDLDFLFGHQAVKEIPESLKLVFGFKVSHPGNSDQCEIGALETRPIWFQFGVLRLSRDLDIVFKDAFEGRHANSDLRVRVDKETAIPVHRCILSARSDHLKDMIIEKARRSPVDNVFEISLTCAGHKTLYYILRCIYSDKLSEDIDFMDLLDIYITSNINRIEILTKRCLKLMRSKVNLKHLKLVLQLWDERKDMQLLVIAVLCIRENKDGILNTPEWADIMKEIPGQATRAFQDTIYG